MGSSVKSSGGRSTKNEQSEYVAWFEIPALNLPRAVAFYESIFEIKLQAVDHQEYAMALFPPRSGRSGAVVTGPGCEPSETGPLLYLNAGNDLNAVLARVAAGGGRVVLAPTLIDGEGGHFAIFIDTEGNRLALHANQ